MALPVITSRNPIQKIPTTALNERKVDESPAAFYTCPTGKKAVITGGCMCTGLGAASEVRLLAAAVAVVRYDSGVLNVSVPFVCSLAAGETLAKGQNSGTNGELDLTCSVLETPA